MFFNDIERLRIKLIVGGFCQKRIPSSLRNQVKLFYEVRGFVVKIIESKPVSDRSHEWIERPIARMKFDPDTLKWQLYWRRASGRWGSYPLIPTNRLKTLIEEIDQDPHDVFWG
jgi:hypothetical protein